MSSYIPRLAPEEVVAVRAKWGIPEGIGDRLRGPAPAGDPIILATIDAAFDRVAGPYALTDTERIIRWACRLRFGLYEPTAVAQIAFIRGIRRGLSLGIQGAEGLITGR